MTDCFLHVVLCILNTNCLNIAEEKTEEKTLKEHSLLLLVPFKGLKSHRHVAPGAHADLGATRLCKGGAPYLRSRLASCVTTAAAIEPDPTGIA